MQRDLVFSEAVDLAPPVQKPALKAPWHLFAIGPAAVLWSLLGIFDFLATYTVFPPYMERLPEAARQHWATLPDWIYAVWALAVFSSLVGAVMLLKRRVTGVRMLAFSAVTTMITMGASYSRTGADFDASRVHAVCIIVVSLLLLNYAYHQAKQGVLR
jgi:hypothetical protein